MKYHKISDEFLSQLRAIVPEAAIKSHLDVLQAHSRDYTEDLCFLPEIVVFPTTAKEVADIAGLCNQHLIPLTTRGAGTGLSGGCLPVYGGVVLAMSAMNNILEIDTNNMQARLQPGVVNQDLKNAVEAFGMYYPPDPASLGSCYMGGNVAHASGGPRAVKYGTTKDYILNLQVALPSGELIWTGANTLKNSTGYNLTQLMIGSEGTLGIVTEIVVKLVTKPTRRMLLFTRFANAQDACAFIPALLKKGVVPSALEFMETLAVQIAANELNINVQTDGIEAFVLIEVDGFDENLLMKDCEVIYEVLESYNAMETELAETSAQQESLWKLRRVMGEAVKKYATYKEEDTVVPRFELPRLFAKVKELEKEYGFQSVCYGHAGDGNLHVNILKNNLTEEQWNTELPKAITALFTFCKEVGGTISGEHGIGLVQKNYLPIVYTQSHINLFAGIKAVFDPNNILNPGKIFA